MKKTAEVVVIGGGISGAPIAYYLAKKGVKNVVLLEKNFIASGATGRSAAGIRSQYGTEMNCIISKFSCDILEHAQEELEYDGDLELVQGGYLMLASTEKEREQFIKNIALQNSLGIESVMLSVEETRELVPFLNTDGLLCSAFHQKDGHMNPFHTTQAYINAAKRLGVEVYTYTEVTDVVVENGRVTGVKTNKGDIATNTVVNAAGGWSQKIGQMAGVDLPLYSERHQILVTEPIEEILKPMVLSFSLNMYCKQVPHGGILMGRGDENEPRDLRMTSSWQFLDEVAKTIIHLMPPLKNVRMLRQWAGLYNMSPDRQPIYGPVDEVAGFYIAAGFSGHGFHFGPATGIIISEYILGEKLTLPVEGLTLNRFKEGKLIFEPNVV
jgi:sarcosine oxidase, subunit beta